MIFIQRQDVVIKGWEWELSPALQEGTLELLQTRIILATPGLVV